jgi:hypothetical protein
VCQIGRSRMWLMGADGHDVTTTSSRKLRPNQP